MSYYELFPGGDQKVYNGVTNFFLSTVGTETVSNITHDRGYSAWVQLTLGRFLYIEPAYVHSIKLNNRCGHPNGRLRPEIDILQADLPAALGVANRERHWLRTI